MSSDLGDFFIQDDTDRKILLWSGILAAMLELTLLTAMGIQSHWLAHPASKSDGRENFVEAQIFELPKENRLVEQNKPVALARHEVTLSKEANKGREAKPDENKVQDENQTESGPKLAPTHGPVAVYSPSPHIPAYLQEKELHVSVVIDFFVSAQGQTTPRLVGSSGNEELDAIAIDTAKKWQFRPAETDHKAKDSKVRLRIVFDVQ
jgi:TonB family protein